jgi:hypothetical protein
MRMRVGKRDARWWSQVRQARDATLAILRGPIDLTVLAIITGPHVPPPWLRDDVWAAALHEVEAWSARLEAAHVRWCLEQTYGLTGSA